VVKARIMLQRFWPRNSKHKNSCDTQRKLSPPPTRLYICLVLSCRQVAVKVMDPGWTFVKILGRSWGDLQLITFWSWSDCDRRSVSAFLTLWRHPAVFAVELTAAAVRACVEWGKPLSYRQSRCGINAERSACFVNLGGGLLSVSALSLKAASHNDARAKWNCDKEIERRQH